MLLEEQTFRVPRRTNQANLLDYFSREITTRLAPGDIPIRFVVTQTDSLGHQCEIGVLSHSDGSPHIIDQSVFEFNRRVYENTDRFNTVLLIPTGIGADIGGHAGDATPVARLLADSCDTLILHPNVVNASDINEMPENSLYVEGSVVTRLLMGTVGLQKVRSNRVMLVTDKHEDEYFREATVNSVSAARATLGLECSVVVEMSEKITMRSLFTTSGRAVGLVERLELLCDVLEQHRGEYDAVAISSLIDVPDHFHTDYFRDDIDMVNPWGGVEAMLTHCLSLMYDVPTAHSPITTSSEIMNLSVGMVDPRKAAETVSTTYLHCILKGLHKSPRIVSDPSVRHSPGLLTAADVSCLVIPDGCIGLPTLAALEQGIPIVAVRENKNRMQNSLEELPFAPDKLFIVNTYLEAAGIINALRVGVTPASVRRPLARTRVVSAT